MEVLKGMQYFNQQAMVTAFLIVFILLFGDESKAVEHTALEMIHNSQMNRLIYCQSKVQLIVLKKKDGLVLGPCRHWQESLICLS